MTQIIQKTFSAHESKYPKISSRLSWTVTFHICFNKSLLKIMKNAFYFNLKALFTLKIFKFLS